MLSDCIAVLVKILKGRGFALPSDFYNNHNKCAIFLSQMAWQELSGFLMFPILLIILFSPHIVVHVNLTHSGFLNRLKQWLNNFDLGWWFRIMNVHVTSQQVCFEKAAQLIVILCWGQINTSFDFHSIHYILM